MVDSEHKTSFSEQNDNQVIYDDIDDTEIFATTHHSDDTVSHQQANNDLLEENKNLKKSVEELQEANKLLELRISQLYLTAKTEIERKDQRINEMRIEKENMFFRRNNRNQYVSNDQSSKNISQACNFERTVSKSNNIAENIIEVQNETSLNTDNKCGGNSESKCIKFENNSKTEYANQPNKSSKSEDEFSGKTSVIENNVHNQHNTNNIVDLRKCLDDQSSSKKSSNEVLQGFNKNYKIPRRISTYDDINTKSHIEPKHFENVYERSHSYKRNDVYKTCVKENKEDYIGHYMKDKNHTETHRKYIRDNQDRCKNWTEHTHSDNMEYMHSESAKHEPRYHRSYSPNKFNSRDRDGKDGYQHFKRNSRSRSRSPDRAWRKCSHHRARNRSRSQDRNASKYERKRYQRSRSRSRERYGTYYNDQKHLSYNQHSTCGMWNRRCSRTKETFRDRFLKNRYESSQINVKGTTEKVNQNKMSEFKDTESLYSEEDEIKLFLSGESDFEEDKYTKNSDQHHIPDIANMTVSKLERLYIELKSRLNVENIPNTYSVPQFSEDEETDGILDVQHSYLRDHFDNHLSDEQENKDEMEDLIKQRTQQKYNKRSDERTGELSEAFKKRKRIGRSHSLNERYIDTRGNDDIVAKRFKHDRGYDKIQAAADNTRISEEPSKIQASDKNIKECCKDEKNNLIKDNSKVNITTIAGNTNMDGKNPQEINKTDEPTISKIQNITLEEYKKRNAMLGKTLQNQDSNKFVNVDNTSESKVSTKPDFDNMVVAQQSINEINSKFASASNSTVDISKVESSIRSYNLAIIGTNIKSEKVTKNGKTVLLKDKNTDGNNEISKLENDKIKNSGQSNVHKVENGEETILDSYTKIIDHSTKVDHGNAVDLENKISDLIDMQIKINSHKTNSGLGLLQKKQYANEQSCQEISAKNVNVDIKNKTTQNIKHKVTDEVQHQDSVKGDITNNKKSLKHDSKISDLVEKENTNEGQEKNRNANEARIKLNSDRENKTMTNIKNKVTDKVQQVDSIKCSSIDEESFKPQIKGYEVTKERKIEKELDLKKPNATEESSQKLSMKDLNAEHKIQTIANIKNKVTDEVQLKDPVKGNITNNKDSLKHHSKTSDLVKKGNKNERHQQKNQNANKSRIKHNSERENKTMKDIKNKVTDKVQQADSVNCSSIDKESFKQQIKEYDVMKERNIEKELDLNKTNTTEESNKKLSMKDLNAEDKIKGYDVMKERKIEKELDLKKTNTTKESNKKLSMKDLNAEDKIPTIANIKNKVTDEVQLQDSVKGNITNNKESMKHHSKTSDLVKKGNKNERHQQKNQNANKSRIKLNSERENKTMQDIKNKITDKVQQVDSVNCSSIDKESFKQQIKGYDVMKERKIEKELDLKKTNTTEESSQKLSMKDLNAEDKIQTITNIKNKVTDEVQLRDSVKGNITNNKESLKHHSKTSDLDKKRNKNEGQQKNQNANKSRIKLNSVRENKTMKDMKNKVTDKVQQVDSVKCSSIDKESFKQQIKGYDVMKERKIEKELDLKKTNTTEESSKKLSMKDLNAEDKIQAIENIKNKVTDEVQHKYTNSLEDNSTNNKKGLKQQMKTTDQHLAQIAKESNRVENEAKVETEDIKADENMESLNNTIKISNNASDNNIEKNMDTRNVSNCNSENIKHKKTTNTKSNNIKNVKANQPGLKSTNSNNEAEHPSKLTQQCKRKQKYYDDNMKIEAAETLCSLATNQIYEQKLDNKKDQSESVNALREYDSESIQRKLDYRLAEELYITDSDEDEKACKNSKIDTEQNLTKRDQKCVIISNIPVALSQEDLKNLTLKNETTNSKSSINCNPSECIEEIKKEINTEYTKIPQLNAMCKKAENALNTPELEKCLSEDSAIKDTQRRRQPVVKRRSSSRLASIKHVQDAEERQQISVKIAESAKQVKDIFSSASKSIPIKNPDIPFDSPNSFIAKSQAKLSSEKDKKCIPCNDNVTEEKERKSELYQKAKNYIQTKLPRKTGRKCFKKAVKKTTLSRKCPSEKVTGAKPTAKTPRKRKTIEDEAGQTKPAWKIKLADNSKKRNRHDSTSDDPKRKKKKADEERDEKLQIESSKEKLTDTDNTTCSRSNIDMQSVLEVKNTEKITTNQDGTNNISEKIHTPESNSDLNIVVNNGKTLKRITPKRVGECTKNEKSSTVKVLFAEYSTTVVSQETINISQQARDCIKSSVVNIEINTVESNTIKEKSEQNQTAPSSSPLASFENLYLQANLKKLEKQSVVQKSTKSESNKPLTLIRAPEEAEFTDIHIDPITLLGKKEIDNIISDLNISDKNMALSSNSEKNKNDKISHNDGTTVDEKNLKSKTSSLDFLNILSKNTSTPIKNKNPSIKNDSTVSEHTIINSRPQSETINANEESSTKISNLNIPSNTSSDSSSIIIRSNITIGVPLKRDRRRKSTVKIID